MWVPIANRKKLKTKQDIRIFHRAFFQDGSKLFNHKLFINWFEFQFNFYPKSSRTGRHLLFLSRSSLVFAQFWIECNKNIFLGEPILGVGQRFTSSGVLYLGFYFFVFYVSFLIFLLWFLYKYWVMVYECCGLGCFGGHASHPGSSFKEKAIPHGAEKTEANL